MLCCAVLCCTVQCSAVQCSAAFPSLPTPAPPSATVFSLRCMPLEELLIGLRRQATRQTAEGSSPALNNHAAGLLSFASPPVACRCLSLPEYSCVLRQFIPGTALCTTSMQSPLMRIPGKLVLFPYLTPSCHASHISHKVGIQNVMRYSSHSQFVLLVVLPV